MPLKWRYKSSMFSPEGWAARKARGAIQGQIPYSMLVLDMV
jgi:hypothetical protein